MIRRRMPLTLAALVLTALLAVIGASCSALPDGDGETVAGDGNSTDDNSTGDGDATGGEDDDSGTDRSDRDASDGDETDEAAGGDDESDDTTPATTPPEPIKMPDLIGMTDTEARTELADLGLDEPAIQTRESFEAAGLVLEQVPTAGRDVTGAINLVVATSIQPMPDFVGSPIADVRSWAVERGIDIRTESELTDQLPPGEVVSQTPAPGAQPSQEIVVTVADTPVIVDLVDLGWLDDYQAGRRDIEMNGHVFPETITLSPGSRASWATFNLSRDYSALKLDLGLSDTHAFNAIVQVELKADGEVIYSDTIGFGVIQPVELDVTNVLRLSITATQVQGGQTRLGLGNARLIGGAATGG